MSDDHKSPLRKHLDAIQSRVNARHYREFNLPAQGREQVVKHMVCDLVDHLSQRRESGRLANATGVIVAETPEEVRQIEQAVRQKLKERGLLKENESRSILTLRDLKWRDAQKSKASNYEQAEDLIARFNRKVGDFEKGELVKIDGFYEKRNRGDASLVMTLSQDGKKRPLPVLRPASFDLYEEGALRVAIGEQIRCTKNGESLIWDKSIHNYPRDQRDLYRYQKGDQLRVSGFSPDGYLKVGFKEISNKFYHLEYGYAATPEQLPVCADKVLVHGEKSLNHPRVREAMEQARESVEVYQEKEPEREPPRDRGFEHELTLED